MTTRILLSTLLCWFLLSSNGLADSYSIQIHAGLNLIANQLDHGSNTVAELFPDAPDGSLLSKYDNASGTWNTSAFNIATGWSPGDITLNPGEGAFVQSPTNFTLTFTGTPHVPVLPVSIPNGSCYLVSQQTADPGSYDTILSASPTDGSTVYQWFGSNYNSYTFSAGVWLPSTPTVAVGEAVWLQPTGGSGPPPLSVAPLITHQPVAQSVSQGASAIFTVAAVGTPPPNYHWRFNLVDIPSATNTILTVSNVQATNTGFFDVVISNQAGLVISAPAALKVTGVFPERFTLGLGAVPLGFVQNFGQSDSSVAFQASSLGAGTVFLMTNGQVQLALGAYDEFPASLRQIQFLDANPVIESQGTNPTPTSTTYLLGNDPAAWHTNLPNFATVLYPELYDGISVSYSGAGRWLKTTFTLAPGVDPNQIAWTYVNASSIMDSPSPGNLLINFPVASTNGGPTNQTLELFAPTASQGTNISISIVYQTNLIGRIGFLLGGYDTNQPLTIESGLLFSPHFDPHATTLGGSHIYVAGGTYAATLPSAGQPSQSAFVAILNSQGNALNSLTLLGGTGKDIANDVAVDAVGNIYAAGGTTSTNFPLTTPLQGTNGGDLDAFVIKLDPTGQRLLRGTYLGGPCCDIAHGILINGSNRVFVCGLACTNFPWSAPHLTNFATLFPAGIVGCGSNYFVADLTPDLDQLEHFTRFTASPVGRPVQIWMDASGIPTIGIGTYDFKTEGCSQQFTMSYNQSYIGYPDVNNNGAWGAHALRWRSLVAKHQTPACTSYNPNYAGQISPFYVDQNGQAKLNAIQGSAIPSCNLNSSWDFYQSSSFNILGYEAALGAAMFMHYFASPIFVNLYADSSFPTTVPAIIKDICFDYNVSSMCSWPQQANSIQQLFTLDLNCALSLANNNNNLASINSVTISYWPVSPDQNFNWIVEDLSLDGPTFLSFFLENGFPSAYRDNYVGDPPQDQRFVLNHIKEATRQLRTSLAETITTKKIVYQNGQAVTVSTSTNRVRAVDLPPAYLLSTGPFSLNIAQVNSNVIISWRALNVVLEQAGEVTGPWTPVLGVTTPFTVPHTAPRQFYRLRR